MKRNFKKRFRGLFLTISLAVCGCGNYVVQSKSIIDSLKNKVLMLTLFFVISLAARNFTEKEIEEFVNNKIDETLKENLKDLDKDEQENGQKINEEDKVYRKVGKILKDYLKGMAEANGGYAKLALKLFWHRSKIEKFLNMENKYEGRAKAIWYFLSLKYYEEFDGKEAQKDKRIQEDLLNIINGTVDIIAVRLLRKDCLKSLASPLKEYIKKRAGEKDDWITATTGFFGAVQALTDMPSLKKMTGLGDMFAFGKKVWDMVNDLYNAGKPGFYKFENYTKEDYWRGWEAYF